MHLPGDIGDGGSQVVGRASEADLQEVVRGREKGVKPRRKEERKEIIIETPLA